MSTEYSEVWCDWLEKRDDDPRTTTRDGFCINCGSTDHESVEAHLAQEANQ